MRIRMAMMVLCTLFSTGTLAKTVEVTAKEFAFVPESISVHQGESVTIVLENEGALSHNLHIPELDVEVETIQTDGMTRHSFTPDKTGTFTFFCAVPGHKQAGMRGTLKVK